MPTLYLTGHRTKTSLVSNRLEITRPRPGDEDREETVRVPLMDLERVAVVGRAYLPGTVLHALLRRGIPVSYLTRSGHYLGSLLAPVNGSALLRIRQYEAARDAELGLRIARGVVQTKIRNSRRVLQRLASNRGVATDSDIQNVLNSMLAVANRADTTANLDELRGFEGAAAGFYFGLIGRFFPEATPFTTRSRRPPRDPANALLSWCYTLVQTEVQAAVCAAGLDPCLGFLHGIEYGRPSLALDLLEPLRAPVCDMLTLHLLNHGILKAEDFERGDEGGYRLGAAGRKGFFVQYEQRMERLFKRPDTLEHTSPRKALREQVYAVVHVLRGDEELKLFVAP